MKYHLALKTVTYNDMYGYAPDGGARVFCYSCMGTIGCAAFPQDPIKRLKNLICSDCRINYSSDKKLYKELLRSIKITIQSVFYDILLKEIDSLSDEERQNLKEKYLE